MYMEASFDKGVYIDLLPWSTQMHRSRSKYKTIIVDHLPHLLCAKSETAAEEMLNSKQVT